MSAIPTRSLLFLLVFQIAICLAKTGQCRLKPPANVRRNDPAQVPFGNTASATPTVLHGPSASPTNTPMPSSAPFNYSRGKVRGVNLGGWLVLEPWITPTLFQRTGNDGIIDEYTLGQLMDRDAALAMLKTHWDTWITEDDFIAIKAAGLNHVRIPLGYWSIPTSNSTSSSPYIPGAYPYLQRAVGWAKRHGVHVIVDLHGAPGSQNGYDNSGQRTNDPQWALNPEYVTRTLDAIRYLANDLGGSIDTIELLNEAAGFRGEQWQKVVRQFWLDGYKIVREVAGNDIKVMIGDAFMGIQSWTNFLNPPSAQGVFLDFHEYQIFSDLELNRTVPDHVSFACSFFQTLPSFSSQNIPVILGEWSNALTDCAKWLNGRGTGSRWDASYFPTSRADTFYHGSCDTMTGSYRGFSAEYKNALRQYWEVQVNVGESVGGWIFWTWKAENADEWSYQKGLEGGWIPKDPTEKKYPNICSS